MPTTTGVLTNYAEAKILDHKLKKTTWSFPTCYLGLLVATPDDTGGTEVTTAGTNGYSRQACGTGGSSIFNAAASRSITTNADVTWGPSTGGPWSTVAYWGLFDASTGGNLLAYGDVTDGTVGTDDSFRILAGNLTLTFTAGSDFTTAQLNGILDHLVGRTTMGAAVDCWLALYDGDPLGAGSEAHTAGNNGYARVALDDLMSAASGGSITNGSAIDYGPASGAAWGTVDYVAIMDASTAGSVVAGFALNASKTINDGDSASFAASAFNFTLD